MLFGKIKGKKPKYTKREIYVDRIEDLSKKFLEGFEPIIRERYDIGDLKFYAGMRGYVSIDGDGWCITKTKRDTDVEIDISKRDFNWKTLAQIIAQANRTLENALARKDTERQAEIEESIREKERELTQLKGKLKD